jgi:hypothetical protein
MADEGFDVLYETVGGATLDMSFQACVGIQAMS